MPYLSHIILSGQAAEQPGSKARLRHYGALTGGPADGPHPVVGLRGGGQGDEVRWGRID